MDRKRFYESLKGHQITAQNNFGHHFALRVTLTGSDNPYYKYPVKGVLVVFEQGTDLNLSQTVFHALLPDGSLGAPTVVTNSKFTNDF